VGTRCGYPCVPCQPVVRRPTTVTGRTSQLTARGTPVIAATSAPRLGLSLPHLHRDCARPCHICAGTRLTPATSAPGLRSLLPHLHRDCARLCHPCCRDCGSDCPRRTPEGLPTYLGASSRKLHADERTEAVPHHRHVHCRIGPCRAHQVRDLRQAMPNPRKPRKGDHATGTPSCVQRETTAERVGGVSTAGGWGAAGSRTAIDEAEALPDDRGAAERGNLPQRARYPTRHGISSGSVSHRAGHGVPRPAPRT
jgi:hypothetical protein